MENYDDIRLILFDFGGVLADEGFKNGLFAIAQKNGKDAEQFLNAVREIIYASGFIIGQVSEAEFWRTVRDRTGVAGSDEELRGEILSRFTLRPWMFEIVAQLKAAGYRVGILSDQVTWLDELDRRDGVFEKFDVVMNSFYLGKSKRDASIFSDAGRGMMFFAPQMLFIDDDKGNVERARGKGLHAIWYRDQQSFMQQIKVYCAKAFK